MFKKTKIAAVSAAVLGLSSMAAQAVSVNDAGSEGQVLIFPYYNVNNNFVTNFNIVNTTGDYKAVKIRYRESEHSNDVIDFNLYMSPLDVFTMQLRSKVSKSDGSVGVVMTTKDKSCTHPAIPAAGVDFRHGAYDSTSAADVREGYLEVIEMGVVSETATISTGTNTTQLIASEGILHNAAGVPLDCSVIQTAWVQNVFVQGGARSNGIGGDFNTVNPDSLGTYPAQTPTGSAPGRYGVATNATGGLDSSTTTGSNGTIQTDVITEPTGGLVGTSILVDATNVVGFVAEPTAIVDYSTVAQHYLSSDENFYLLPSLASGSTQTSNRRNASNEAAGTFVTYALSNRDWGMDDPFVAPRTGVPSGINPMPISDAMLATVVGNQYFLEGGTLTDWVLSAPMRKHAIYNDYQYFPNGTGFVAATDIPVSGGAVDGTDGYWSDVTTATNPDVNGAFTYLNREEGGETPPPGDFSPPVVIPGGNVPFVREVNVLVFSPEGVTDTSVLGSNNSQRVEILDGFANGWATINFNAYNLNSTRYTAWTGNTASAAGVPVHGFMSARSALGSESLGETIPNFYTRP